MSRKRIHIYPAWISSALKLNRKAILDFRTTVCEYVDALPRIRTPNDWILIDYFSRILSFKSRIETVTAIPAHVRESGLTRALQAYASQAHLSRHAIVVFLNAGPETGKRAFDKLLTARLREVDLLRKRCPQLSIFMIHRHLDRVPMGRIRGLLVDSIAAAAVRANLKRLIVISNDADQWSVSRGYLKTIKTFFEENPRADGAEGKLIWGDEAIFARNPELWLQMRYLESLKRFSMRFARGTTAEINFSGNNSFFRLESYCAVGGHSYSRISGEDQHLGRELETRRTSRRFVGYAGKVVGRVPEACISSNPRRVLKRILDNQVIVEEYSAEESADLKRELGTDYCLESICRRLHRSRKFLSAADMASASRGLGESERKVMRRIEEILRILFREGPWIRRAAVHPFAQSLGLKFRGIVFSKRRGTNVRVRDFEIDWNKSTFLREALRDYLTELDARPAKH